VIPLAEYERERSHLAEQLEALTDPNGQPLNVKAFKPQQIYQKVRGIAPDLIVYFDDLAWRSVGSVGMGSIYTTDNDTGPDDANHAPYGMMMFYDPKQPKFGQEITGAQLYDILPTLLSRYGIPTPTGLRGKILPV
jgi:predicted AlkP superfamily phosphohydrolase/phosphomutase